MQYVRYKKNQQKQGHTSPQGHNLSTRPHLSSRAQFHRDAKQPILFLLHVFHFIALLTVSIEKGMLTCQPLLLANEWRNNTNPCATLNFLANLWNTLMSFKQICLLQLAWKFAYRYAALWNWAQFLNHSALNKLTPLKSCMTPVLQLGLKYYDTTLTLHYPPPPQPPVGLK